MDELSLDDSISAALAAEEAREWARALDLWKAALNAAPTDLSAIIGVSASHLRLRRFAENDAFLSDVMRSSPEDVAILIEYARTAEQNGLWSEAATRWRWTRSRYPDEFEAIRGLGSSLTALGHFDEAEDLLAGGLTRNPSHKWIAFEHARLAEARGDWTTAQGRWRNVINVFPDLPDGYVGLAITSIRLGQYDEAERVLRLGRDRLPLDASIAVEYARAAEVRNAWSDAVDRWSTASQLDPDDPDIAVSASSAKANGRSLVAQGADSDAPQTLEDPQGHQQEAMTPRQVFMAFESLGSNCEFGVVQRHYGAEPLALFRWAAIDPEDLVRGLKTEFAGLGEAITLTPSEDRLDYYLSEDRFFIGMHTFIPVDEQAFPQIMEKQAARLRFLRDKLLDDLRGHDEASKIYVYKNPSDSLSHFDMVSIHRAVRRFGPHTVLFVQLERANAPAGSVEWLDEGLLVGYIEALSPGAVASEIHYASWLQICTKALDMAVQRIRTVRS